MDANVSTTSGTATTSNPVKPVRVKPYRSVVPETLTALNMKCSNKSPHAGLSMLRTDDMPDLSNDAM